MQPPVPFNPGALAMLTLEDIDKYSPCPDGRAKLLAGLPFLSTNPESPFPLRDAFAKNSTQDIIWALRTLHPSYIRMLAAWMTHSKAVDTQNREMLYIAREMSQHVFDETTLTTIYGPRLLACVLMMGAFDFAVTHPARASRLLSTLSVGHWGFSSGRSIELRHAVHRMLSGQSLLDVIEASFHTLRGTHAPK